MVYKLREQLTDPRAVGPCDHAPVDGLVVTSAETDTNGGTDNALGGGDGQGKTCSHDDCDGGTELHAETT